MWFRAGGGEMGPSLTCIPPSHEVGGELFGKEVRVKKWVIETKIDKEDGEKSENSINIPIKKR
jgi:hypothetical protein